MGRCYYDHVVFSAEWIIYAPCIGIFAPFAIDYEAVMITARRKLRGDLPHSSRFFIKRNRLALPFCEIAYQQHAQSRGRFNVNVCFAGFTLSLYSFCFPFLFPVYKNTLLRSLVYSPVVRRPILQQIIE